MCGITSGCGENLTMEEKGMNVENILTLREVKQD